MLGFYRKVLTRLNARKNIPAPVTELYLEVKKYLPSDPVIMEAGAHMGFDTYGLAKIWPGATIYAFEPVPVVYASLVDRLKEFSNVKTFNVALGENNAQIQMHVSSGASTASSSLLKPSAHLKMFPSVTFGETIDVPVKRLEEFATLQNLKPVDFMWLDMQGYEVYALKGSGRLLDKVSVIYTELCKHELYSGLVTRDEYIQFLESKNFELVSELSDDEVTEGIFINRDAIAARKR